METLAGWSVAGYVIGFGMMVLIGAVMLVVGCFGGLTPTVMRWGIRLIGICLVIALASVICCTVAIMGGTS